MKLNHVFAKPVVFNQVLLLEFLYWSAARNTRRFDDVQMIAYRILQLREGPIVKEGWL
jgi:hypothetical protein